MAKYRSNLPQLGDKTFLTDSGLETTLIFHEGVDLPHFASIGLHVSEEGEQRLRDYFLRHIAIAKARKAGFILESTSWRASPDWGAKLGFSPSDLITLNRKSIALLVTLRAEHETPQCPMPISGNIGPRGDGYSPERMMSGAEAMCYHAFQCDLFADTEADMISAFTMTHSGEAIGIARAAAAVEMPVVISFTTETDGRLPSGETMREAIEKTDDATSGAPVYYMINCAHPTHFAGALEKGEAWLKRLRGLRANASTRSHAELDNSPDLDAGDPVDLGRRYAHLRGALGTRFNILGGCCGTDHRHLAAIAEACLPLRVAA
ncbi:MAG: homocysteine S-methyltransferase family protein [Pseudorhodoplanes sp.]